MLAGSQAVVSAWEHSKLVGFGRANSDGVFRAVLWVYVMTTQSSGFYTQLGFTLMESQHLMVRSRR